MGTYLHRMGPVLALATGMSIVACCICAWGGGRRQGLGVTAADLQSLAYGNNLPGFHQLPATRGGTGPLIQIDHVRRDNSMVSGITSVWDSDDGLNRLRIELWILRSPEAAESTSKSYLAQCSHPPDEMPANLRIGDSSWAWSPPDPGFRVFVLGRTFVTVDLQQWWSTADRLKGIRRRPSQLDGHQDEIADTLARGIEWAILQRPDLLSQPGAGGLRTLSVSGRSIPRVKAVALHSVAWAPLTALKQAGADVMWDQKANRATATYRGHTLQLACFQRTAMLDGQKINLGAAVLVGHDGPVVPIVRVAEALGIKVASSAKTLKLG